MPAAKLPPTPYPESREVQVLLWILEEEKLQTALQQKISSQLNTVIDLLKQLQPQPADVTAFTFTLEKTMQPFTPGTSPAPVITITPNNPLNPAQPVPATTCSDPTNYPISVDSTGLLVTVNTVAQTATGFTLTTTYTNADGTVATSTSQTFGASTPPPPADVTSFTFAQTT